jgi:tRNA (cmo5U34)-methyltransferase
MSTFDDPVAVAHYADRPPRLVPGFHDLHRMAAILLVERAGPVGHILVLGAGGGLEMNAFATTQPGWRFTGVDPSAAMLGLARTMTTPHAERITLHEGYIDTAPPGPFDGATCILTLHFVPREERVATLKAIRQRLKPGAHFVMAHFSYPGEPVARALWLSRYAEFGAASGLDPESTRAAGVAIADRLPVLTPAQEEAALAEAGFTDVALFYAGLAFRGWVATAP